MRNKQFMLYLLGIFITTIIMIVFLQYNSNGNINKLIHGNEALMNEFEIIGTTQKLQTDMLYVESEIHRAVIGEDSSYLPGIQMREKNVRAGLDRLKVLLLTDSTRQQIERLDSLIEEKLKFSDNILDALFINGQVAAEEMYKSRKGKNAMGEIVDAINVLSNPRREYLTQLAVNAEKSGHRARTWGMILAVTAVLACIFTFWYITKRIKKQQQLFDQLNESEKKVREAGIMKQNFMANMSHEIRTPMNAIMGFTNLLQKEPLNEKSTEFVRNIEHAGENLLTIINDVLDFSKIEAGMMRIELSPFSLRELLHSVETMFVSRIQPKNLQLAINIEKSVPDMLKGDAVRLTQIIVNLVSNAVKFTNTGGIYIRVTARQANENTAELSFSVRDTGIGIPADKMDTIFERFQQVDENTTRKYGGTGLGLSIVKQLVELQHGTISVSSVQNMGTEFVFTIPYELVTDLSEKMNAELPADYEGGLDINNIRILVAEDNVMNQNLVRHLLTGWELDFKIVNNGAEAIETLRQGRFNLVLMDIQMPQLDGYTATQKIRNELQSDIPIVAMTAHAMAGEREKCLAYGMNEYISKPIREKELFTLIHHLLNSSREMDNAGNSTEGYSGQVLNLAYLKELSGGDQTFETSMIDQFLKQVPAELSMLLSAFEVNDYEKVAGIAHNLKTSVSFMGLTDRLDGYLTDIEMNVVADKGGSAVKEKIMQVDQICKQAMSEALEYLGSHH